MPELTFEVADEVGRERLGDMLSHGFAFPLADAAEWFERGRHENLRVLRRDGHVVAGLMHIPMGQFFGGVSVPTVGIAGVGVAVEERGTGVATALMLSSLREARSKGFPLSTLYAATVTLYRRVGYERAGSRCRIELDPRTLNVPRDPGISIREVTGLTTAEAVTDELRALYTSVARENPGYLDRGPYVWKRVVAPRGHTTKTFVIVVDGRPEGYVVVSHRPEAGYGTALVVTDLVAQSTRAGQAILRLLGEYRSVATKVTWHGAAVDTFTSLLPERHHTISVEDFFMLRIVEPAAALAARGYPRLVSTEVVLELEDRSLPENSGLFTLSVADGKAVVTKDASDRAGRSAPHVRLDERALATLYSGHTPLPALTSMGWVEGDDEASQRLAAIFAGPAPSMREMF